MLCGTVASEISPRQQISAIDKTAAAADRRLRTLFEPSTAPTQTEAQARQSPSVVSSVYFVRSRTGNPRPEAAREEKKLPQPRGAPRSEAAAAALRELFHEVPWPHLFFCSPFAAQSETCKLFKMGWPDSDGWLWVCGVRCNRRPRTTTGCCCCTRMRTASSRCSSNEFALCTLRSLRPRRTCLGSTVSGIQNSDSAPAHLTVPPYRSLNKGHSLAPSPSPPPSLAQLAK